MNKNTWKMNLIFVRYKTYLWKQKFAVYNNFKNENCFNIILVNSTINLIKVINLIPFTL